MTDDGNAEIEVPLWLQASVEDVNQIDIDGPLSNCRSGHCYELSAIYLRLSQEHAAVGEAAAPAARVFSMLAAVADFHFRPESPNSPYSYKIAMEGRRSPIPEDFRGGPVATLKAAALKTENPVLKARLSDVCWLLDRRQIDLAKAAISAYIETINYLANGDIKDELEDKDQRIGYLNSEFLERALTISKFVRDAQEERDKAVTLASQLRTSAIAHGDLNQVRRYCEIDLKLGGTDATMVADQLEELLGKTANNDDELAVASLWRLAAAARQRSKDEAGAFRNRAEAAEALARHAAKQTSASLAAHFLGEAISAYHGIPGKQERRRELRKLLVSTQERVPDEMPPIYHSTDISEIVRYIEKECDEKRSIKELIFFLALSGKSPTPEKLLEDALASIRKYPLSALFSRTFLDRSGKVIHRANRGGFGERADDEAIRAQIAQQEAIRRQLFSVGTIYPILRKISERRHVGINTIAELLASSPAIPEGQLMTISRGFANFFDFDFIGAIYILAPMTESIIRNILKRSGVDVSKFDDAAQTQEDRPLSSIFQDLRKPLEEIIGRNIVTDIESVFLYKGGPCIRHSIAHGTMHDDESDTEEVVYACWLLFHLCCLPLRGGMDQIEIAE